ncbi:MAG: UDPGP type 1 family protein [Planctomycetota bacterium]
MTATADLASRLAAAGQDHLLRFEAELTDTQREALHTQLGSIDFGRVPGWVENYVTTKPEDAMPSHLEPAPYYPADPASAVRRWDRSNARAAGEALIRAGKVAAFVVAGGQGSRLGYDGPKGCYPAGAITGAPLFKFFADSLLGVQDRYGVVVPWYIMTSPLNHPATVAFFEEHKHFGLDPESVMFFSQGVMPSFDAETGKVLLAEKHRVATNPDGHGGSITALHTGGALEDMAKRGVDHLSYFQVDNPMVRVIDPIFIGLHASAEDSSGEASSKMLPKARPEEKVGVFVRADDRLRVIEYSDLPSSYANERTDDGRLRFLSGSPAIHMFSRSFLERITSEPDFELPFHRADKKVPHVDLETGDLIEPSSPNGVKLEKFVFDALPLATESIVMETAREEEFGPIKNAEGIDSAVSSRELQTARAARWLAAAGVSVPLDGDGKPDCVIELSPRTASEAQDLKGASGLPSEIKAGERVAL